MQTFDNAGCQPSKSSGLADLARQSCPSTGMQATIRSLQLDERMIALAAAISIDYDYFSQHSHGHGLLGPMMFPGAQPLQAMLCTHSISCSDAWHTCKVPRTPFLPMSHTPPVWRERHCQSSAQRSPPTGGSVSLAHLVHIRCPCARQMSFACSIADGTECPAPGRDAKSIQRQCTAAASWY